MRIITTLVALLIPTLLAAGQMPNVCPNELSSWLRDKRAVSIVDIQDGEDYDAHNYAHSIATLNNPARLKKVASRLRSTSEIIIVVSATGGSDALQAIEQLVNGGVQRPRILVLEGGMEAAVKNASCDCCKPASIQGVAK